MEYKKKYIDFAQSDNEMEEDVVEIK